MIPPKCFICGKPGAFYEYPFAQVNYIAYCDEHVHPGGRPAPNVKSYEQKEADRIRDTEVK